MSGERHSTWRWPVALAILTCTGLATALVSDGWGDQWAWFALGLPLAAAGWYGVRRRQR